MKKIIEDIINHKNIPLYDSDYNKKVANVFSYHDLNSKIKQIDLNELLSYIKNENLATYYINEVKSIKEEFLYSSEIHGIGHNIRVMLYALVLSNMLNISEEDRNIVMTAAKYHDIGRINDLEDASHGKRSADKITSIISTDYENIDMLRAVIELHSISDTNFDKIKEKYNIKDKDKFKILYSILKDADALDRIRISYGYDGYSELNLSMLRFKESLSLVKASHQLNEYFVKEINLKKKIILDTDIENEIDDKFALAYLLKSLDIFDVEAITIAPFHGSKYSVIKNNTVDNIEEGINASYKTTLKIMDMMDIDLKDRVYKGSTGVIDNGYNEDNDAVRKIIDICSKNENINILAIAGLTNIALALKKAPEIGEKISLIWLGGNSLSYNRNDEFNFRQDIKAVKEVFKNVPDLTVIPCINVASSLITTIYELEHYLNDTEIGKYLCSEYRRCKPEKIGKSKTIWDLSVIAYLINKSWFELDMIKRPDINDDSKYITSDNNEKRISFVKRLSRDSIFEDFYKKM